MSDPDYVWQEGFLSTESYLYDQDANLCGYITRYPGEWWQVFRAGQDQPFAAFKDHSAAQAELLKDVIKGEKNR